MRFRQKMVSACSTPLAGAQADLYYKLSDSLGGNTNAETVRRRLSCLCFAVSRAFEPCL